MKRVGFELSLRPNVISVGVDDGVFGGRYEAVETLSDVLQYALEPAKEEAPLAVAV